MTVITAIPDAASLSEVMRKQAAAGFGFRNEVYRGALAGEYKLVELLPRGRVPAPMLWPDAPHTVVVIGDDGGISSGPADFPQSRRLIAWADRVMLHAAGGQAAHYALVAAAARVHRRVLLIETNTSAEAAWSDQLRGEIDRRAAAGLPQLAVLVVQVPAGEPPHPSKPSNGEKTHA